MTSAAYVEENTTTRSASDGALAAIEMVSGRGFAE
jgi:hypothetical protein